jgi:molecular chaperone GrpE
MTAEVFFMTDKATQAEEQASVEEEETHQEVLEEGAAEAAQSDLQEQLAEAQAQAAEYLDGWQRARAELANYKRRVETQRAEMVFSANADLLIKLLPILDDLELAVANSPNGDAEAWKEWSDGIALILAKFHTVLTSVGVSPIPAEGETFDPNIHEAISHEPSPDHESGQIIAQVRQGYKLGDRVLRASLVRVAQ